MIETWNIKNNVFVIKIRKTVNAEIWSAFTDLILSWIILVWSLYRSSVGAAGRSDWPACVVGESGGVWSDSASTSMSGLAARRAAVSPAEHPLYYSATTSQNWSNASVESTLNDLLILSSFTFCLYTRRYIRVPTSLLDLALSSG